MVHVIAKKSIRQCDNDTRLGKIYHGMLNRCENANNTKYHDYGGEVYRFVTNGKHFRRLNDGL